MALQPQISRPKTTQLSSFKLGPLRVAADKRTTTLQGSELAVIATGQTSVANGVISAQNGGFWYSWTLNVSGVKTTDTIFVTRPNDASPVASGSGPASFVVLQARCETDGVVTFYVANVNMTVGIAVLAGGLTVNFMVVR